MLKKAKSIEELYEQTKQYDLVITNDAPLNTALNKQLNKPHLGNFALTSKLLGTKYADYLFEEEKLQLEQIVLKVQNKFNLNLKEALHYTKNILNIWQKVGDLKTTKNYLSKKELPITNYIEQLPTYQKAMEELQIEFLNKQNIVVIGEEIFTNLDKRVLPKNYTTISLFKEQSHQLDTFYQFTSQKEIVDQITSMITKENQNGIAIVLDIESEYLPLLKAKLINNNIQLNEKLYLFQDFRVREYLSIIETLFSMHNIYTKEVLPIGTVFNIDIDTSYQNTLFHKIAKVDQQAGQLQKILHELKNKTFGEIVTELKKYDILLPEEFIKILKNLELTNKKITSKDFLDLKYFIENFDIEIETNKQGVLLVDAKNSVYINREVIFYVDMNHNWVKSIEKQNYVDSEKELEKNIKSFEILLQQGKERFFFITKSQTTPPYYFNMLLESNVESYSNEFFSLKELTTSRDNLESSNTPISNTSPLKELTTISNSKLKSFSQCAKKYEYSELVSNPNIDILERGNLVHAFAEFYVNHKEFVITKGLEEFVEIIMNELELLSNPLQNKILKTKIALACESAMQFIDTLTINDNISFEESQKSKENIFSKHFKLPIVKPNAEFSVNQEKLQLKGVIDLVVDNNLIVDYKTGKKKSVSEIIKNANIKERVSTCDFQPLIYLSIFRDLTPDQHLEFWYQFPMITAYEQLMEKELQETVVKVHYIPQSFTDFLKTKECYEYFYNTAPKYALPILDVLEDFSFIENIEKEPEELFENFYEHLLNQGVKDNKTNKSNSFKILKTLFDFKKGKQNKQKEAFFFKEDLDEFEVFVKTSIEKINQYLKTSFPYNPVEGEDTCKECDFKKMCLKQIEVSK